MAFWMDLLFGNAIGLMSMLTIIAVVIMGGVFAWIFVSKSKQQP